MATPTIVPSASGGFFNSPLFSGILSGLGGLATGLLGNAAANTQANAATTASQQAQNTLKSIYDTQRSDAAPYTLAGYGAINRLSDMFGLNPQRYTTTAPQVQPPQIDESMFPVGRGSISDPSIGYSGGIPYPVNRFNDTAIDYNQPTDFSQYPTLADLTGYSQNAPQNTNQVPANGGQLPSDFGSMNHDFSLADFAVDPGYQFTKSEGQKAIDRSAAARGSVLGGGTIKAQTRYANNLASQQFGDAFNRFQVNRSNKINPLLSLSGFGQTSAGQVASAGTNLGNNTANLIYNGATDAANARASGYAATANGINSGINNINNISLLRQLGRV